MVREGIYAAHWVLTGVSAQTLEDLGLAPQPAKDLPPHEWKYTTLADAPALHPGAKSWSSGLYRGIVLAKHIDRRDFAVNGAVVCPNDSSRERWPSTHTHTGLSQLRLHDRSRVALDLVLLPRRRRAASPRDARGRPRGDGAARSVAACTLPPDTHRAQREPHELSGVLVVRLWPFVALPSPFPDRLARYPFFRSFGIHRWPQHADDLLEDMGLPIMRSGGNALTWPFKVVDLKEISTLKEERDAKRVKNT